MFSEKKLNRSDKPTLGQIACSTTTAITPVIRSNFLKQVLDGSTSNFGETGIMLGSDKTQNTLISFI